MNVDFSLPQMMSQKVTVTVEPIDALDELEREWRLLEAEASPSFFLSWNWIGTLLETVPPEVKPRVLRGTTGGRTVLLAILGDAEIRRHRVIRSRRWVLNATGDPALDCIHVEHNGLLAAPGGGWDPLFEAFTAAREIDELCLPGVATPPPADLVEERGLLRDDAPDTTFAVDLSDLNASGGDVGMILSSNARSQLRRSMRKLGAVEIERAASEAEALAYFRNLKELHIAWWGERGVPHAFVHGFFERFHERLIERAFADGAIQLLRIRNEDRTLGILYNFQRAKHVYAYQSGFALPLAQERPGVIAHALAMTRAWQDGAEIYDFMAGENRLKRSFGNRVDTLSWVVVQKPRLRFHAERRARRLKSRYAHRNSGGGEL
jgi:CelD/BcsL family acetyltransferase involved in cellulose biosynthesis